MNVVTTLHRPELIQVADTVAREKGIDRDEVLDAMEQAIQKAGRSKYGHELDIRASINRNNGEILLARYREVAEEIEDEGAQITPEHAARIDPEKKVGDFIVDPLPPIDFGRIAAQTAKQVIVQKVREAERGRQYEEYKDRVTEVVHGVVKRVEFGHVMVDLGRAEAIVRRDELIPRENFRQGDRIRAYIYDVRQEQRGPQIFLSRTHPQFMAKLFAQEVPEIYDGIIEIRAVARDPGSRAKIAVISNDSSIDPVGACVGMRGSRVQAVSNELAGERVDIILHDENPAQFVINAMSPADVLSIVVDEDAHSMDIAVEEEKLSQAIGRGGQNIRLASELTGWELNVMTETDAEEKSEQEARELIVSFMEDLDVDEDVATILVQEGFSSLEEIAYVPAGELVAIEEFDQEIVDELRARARDVLITQAIVNEEVIDQAQPADDLLSLDGMDKELAFILASRGVVTREDLAEQAVDDLEDIDELESERAGELIMAARAHWFENEQQA